MAGTFFARDNINEKVKHVTLGECCRNITPLERPSLIILSMDPRSHGQFCDEDIATLCE